jgi:FkbM family methyltransferase
MLQVEDRIVAHHVGARGFSVAFNCPPRLSKDLVHVVYEADENCARQMIVENRREDFHIFPFCLGSENRDGKIFITKNAYASSNFEPNSQYSKYYCELHLHGEVDGIALHDECYDVVYGNDYSVVEVRNVAVHTLDSILENRDTPEKPPYPDFLSLDTQGSELAILKGAERTLRDHCLALATEIEFHPMYQGQPLFSDMFNFALNHGFHFVGFTYLQEISSNRLPIGARANGFVAFGDALFLRSIESVRSQSKSSNEVYLSLLKLGFIALNFGYLEYAMEVVDAASEARPDSKFRKKVLERDCFQLLFALRGAVRGLPPQFPHIERTEMTDERKKILERRKNQQIIHQQQTLMDQQSKFIATQIQRIQQLGIERRRLRYLAVTKPLAAAYKLFRYCLRAVMNVPYTDPKEAEILSSLPPELLVAPATPSISMPNVVDPPSPPTTPVESVLEEYGYIWLAEKVRRRRKSAEHCVAGQMY